MSQTPPSYSFPNSTPIKPPEFTKSPQVQEPSYIQKVVPPPSYYPIETHHIYHSPLRSLNYSLSSSNPLRYYSPAKINGENENLQFSGGKPFPEGENIFMLRGENEKLRLALKEKQEEIKSYVAKCAHLERHIKDPTYLIKIEENELRLQAVIRENMRLHEELAQKNEEIQSWRNAFARIELSMNEKVVDFERTNNELRNEIEGWKQKVADLERKLELKDEMFNKFLNDRDEHKEKVKKAGGPSLPPQQDSLSQEQYNELIDKMGVLIKENEKLNFLLQQKMDEFDKMRVLFEQNNLELDQWKMKYKQMNISLEELQKKDWDDENKIGRLTLELENINNLLRNKLPQIEDWKAKFLRLGQLTEKVKEYKEKIYFLTDDNVKLNSMVKSKNLETEALKENVHKLEIQLNNEKTNVEELKVRQLKMQSLEESLAIKNQKMETENQISGFKTEIERLNESLRKMDFFKSENLKLTKNLDELNFEINNLRSSYMEAHKLNQKIQEQNSIIVVFFAEIESLRSRVQEKEDELQRLKNKFYGK